MSRNNLSDIVRVAIEIEEPVTNTTSFNYMLILGPQPTVRDYSKAKAVRNCYVCTSYSEVVDIVKEIVGVSPAYDVGNLDDIPVLDAAKVAFAQSPSPAKIYIAFNKFADRSIESCYVSLANSEEELNNLIDSGNVTAALVKNGSLSPNDDGYTFPPMLVVKYKESGEGVSEATPTVRIYENAQTSNKTGTTSEGYKFAAYKLSDYANKPVTVSIARTVDGIETVFTSAFELADTESGVVFHTEKEEEYNVPYVSMESTFTDALEMNGWYVVCPAYTDPDTLYKLDDIVSAHTKIMSYPVFGDVEEEIPEGSIEYTEDDQGNRTRTTPYNTHDLINNKSLRSFGIYAGTSYGQSAADLSITGEKDNRYLHVAWVAECLNNVAGSESWALKKLVGVHPCEISSTYMNVLKAYNVSYYTTYADRDVTQGGKVAYGEWIDVIRFRDWLENDMQIRVFNTLVKHPKVPYTDEGISLIKNQMIASLVQGQVQGGIAPTEFDADDNEIPGFTVSVPLAANISDIQKKSRILTDCKFRARLAGAIHAVEINGVLAYDIVAS